MFVKRLIVLFTVVAISAIVAVPALAEVTVIEKEICSTDLQLVKQTTIDVFKELKPSKYLSYRDKGEQIIFTYPAATSVIVLFGVVAAQTKVKFKVSDSKITLRIIPSGRFDGLAKELAERVKARIEPGYVPVHYYSPPKDENPEQSDKPINTEE